VRYNLWAGVIRNTPYPVAGIPPLVKRPGDFWLGEVSDRSPRAIFRVAEGIVVGNPLLQAGL